MISEFISYDAREDEREKLDVREYNKGLVLCL